VCVCVCVMRVRVCARAIVCLPTFNTNDEWVLKRPNINPLKTMDCDLAEKRPTNTVTSPHVDWNPIVQHVILMMLV